MNNKAKQFAKDVIFHWKINLSFAEKVKMYNDYLMACLREVDMLFDINNKDDLKIIAEKGFDKMRELVDKYRKTLKNPPYFYINEKDEIVFVEEIEINHLIDVFGEEIFTWVLTNPHWFDEKVYFYAISMVIDDLEIKCN